MKPLSKELVKEFISKHMPDLAEEYLLDGPWRIYRKISNIRCTKSRNLNDSHLVLKSFLLNPLKPGVKSRMKM